MHGEQLVWLKLETVHCCVNQIWGTVTLANSQSVINQVSNPIEQSHCQPTWGTDPPWFELQSRGQTVNGVNLQLIIKSTAALVAKLKQWIPTQRVGLQAPSATVTLCAQHGSQVCCLAFVNRELAEPLSSGMVVTLEVD